ncbi:MAG: hypothetical protein KJ922_05980, partial [Nanoarchaeota archaeon]|nr:hypothetical protein [Nanoarchaeota archaeon]
MQLDNRSWGIRTELVRRVQEGNTAYQLLLRDPVQLDFGWYRSDKPVNQLTAQDQVGSKASKRLWKEYQPQLENAIEAVKHSTEERKGMYKTELGTVLQYNNVLFLLRASCRKRNIDTPDSSAKKGRSRRWVPLSTEYISYMLADYMPIIEGWKKSDDMGSEYGVTYGTINAQLSNGTIDGMRVLGKWRVSPLGEQAYVSRHGRYGQGESKVLFVGGRYLYSLSFAGTEAAFREGHREGSDEHKKRSHDWYNKLVNFLGKEDGVQLFAADGNLREHTDWSHTYVDRETLERAIEIAASRSRDPVKPATLSRDEDMSNLRDRLQQAESELKNARIQYTTVCHRLENLLNEDNPTAALAASQQELKNLRQYTGRLKAANERLKEQTGPGVDKRYKKAEQRIKDLEAQVAELMSGRSDVAATLADDAELELIIEQLKADNQKAALEYAQKVGRLQAELKSKTAELRQAQKSGAPGRSDNVDPQLQKKYDHLQSQYADLEARLEAKAEEYQRRLDSAGAKIEDLTTRYAKASNQLELLTASQTKAAAKLSQAEKANRDLAKRLEKIEETYRKYRENVEPANAQADQKISDLKEKLEAAKQRAQQLESERERLAQYKDHSYQLPSGENIDFQTLSEAANQIFGALARHNPIPMDAATGTLVGYVQRAIKVGPGPSSKEYQPVLSAANSVCMQLDKVLSDLFMYQGTRQHRYEQGPTLFFAALTKSLDKATELKIVEPKQQPVKKEIPIVEKPEPS